MVRPEYFCYSGTAASSQTLRPSVEFNPILSKLLKRISHPFLLAESDSCRTNELDVKLAKFQSTRGGNCGNYVCCAQK